MISVTPSLLTVLMPSRRTFSYSLSVTTGTPMAELHSQSSLMLSCQRMLPMPLPSSLEELTTASWEFLAQSISQFTLVIFSSRPSEFTLALSKAPRTSVDVSSVALASTPAMPSQLLIQIEMASSPVMSSRESSESTVSSLPRPSSSGSLTATTVTTTAESPIPSLQRRFTLSPQAEDDHLEFA